MDTNQDLILDNIHKHWWIQGYSLSRVGENTFHNNENALQSLIQNLQEKYQEWPKIQQEAAQVTLNNMINAPLIVLQDSKVVSTKGHPPGAINKRSTRRDPFEFKLVE